MIYLDYAASSPPFPQVLDTVSTVAREHFGNPGGLHTASAGARTVLQESRKALAALLHVRPEEVFFTSGGTESNNWAIMAGTAATGKKHIICSAAEHKSVLASVRKLQRNGYDVTYLNPARDGRIRPQDLEAAMRPDTALVCVQAVNNETGVVQDVDAIADIVHRRRARYLCDAVQSFGHLRQNLYKADFISLSAHKLGGPRGVGCLVVRYPNRIDPLILGGGQEFSLRSGTENLPGIAGFALAARLSADALDAEQCRLEALSRLLELELRKAVPGLQIAGEESLRSSILNCAFPGISAEEMVMRLDLKGICVSPGAACAAGSRDPSHVMLAMGYGPKEAGEFVRFSPGRNTTEAEILQTACAIADIVNKRN